MSLPLRVLLVEDDEPYARLLRAILGEVPGRSHAITWVASLAEAEARLAAEAFDIVLLDLGLPDAEGIDTVARVVAAAPRAPVVVLSGSSDVDVALEAMRVGAQEYLVKGQAEHELLPRAIRYAVERKRLVDYEPMLVGIVGHDLRGPLQTISLAASLITREGALSPQVKKRAEQILAASARATALVTDLLDVTRGRLFGEMLQVTPSDVDLGAAVREVVEEFQLASGGRRASFAQHGETRGRFDGRRVAQAVMNLVRNAGQHGAQGGAVDVTVSGDPDAVTIDVHNDGAPIDDERLKNLFEPLRRAGAAEGGSGLGLGLYIVQEIVRAHGGRVEATSTAGAGTTFRMVLPRPR